MSTFTLGPLQEKWIQELESGRHHQGTRYLCKTSEDGTKFYCCLGIAAEFVLNLKPFASSLGPFCFAGDGTTLSRFADIGLMSPNASFAKELANLKGDYYPSLASMNDNGVPFKEIAAYIRANPENVFTKSC